MSDVLKTIPKECFEINELKSWRSVAVTVAAVAAGYAAIYAAPWCVPWASRSGIHVHSASYNVPD